MGALEFHEERDNRGTPRHNDEPRRHNGIAVLGEAAWEGVASDGSLLEEIETERERGRYIYIYIYSRVYVYIYIHVYMCSMTNFIKKKLIIVMTITLITEPRIEGLLSRYRW